MSLLELLSTEHAVPMCLASQGWWLRWERRASGAIALTNPANHGTAEAVRFVQRLVLLPRLVLRTVRYGEDG